MRGDVNEREKLTGCAVAIEKSSQSRQADRVAQRTEPQYLLYLIMTGGPAKVFTFSCT